MSSIVKAKSISGQGVGNSFDEEQNFKRYHSQANMNISPETHQEMILQAIRKSRHIDFEAGKRAEIIIEKANRTRTEIEGDAEKQGFAKGFEEGKESGRLEATVKLEKALGEITSIVKTIKQERVIWLENQKEDLATVSLEIAKKIMKQQISLSDEALLKMLEDVIHENRNEASIKIYLSEYIRTMDLRIDKDLCEKIRNIAKNISVTVMKEEEVIMVETSSGIVDISFASQMENIKEAIINTF